MCVKVDKQRLRIEDTFVTENGCDEDPRKACRAVTRAEVGIFVKHGDDDDGCIRRENGFDWTTESSL
jgi:hypothetical protein